VDLERPLEVADGTPVEIDIRFPDDSGEADADHWEELAMARLEETWDNPGDAIYDDWKTLYGV
jgi:hypothetical protein